MASRDIIICVFLAMIWGGNFIFISWGLDVLPPLFFTSLRLAATFLPFALILGRGNVPWPLIIKVGLVMGLLYYTFMFLGMYLGSPAGLTSLLIQSQVCFTLLLSYFILQERVTQTQLLGVIIAFGGLIILGLTAIGDADVRFIGLILVGLAAFCWALSNIIAKQGGDVDWIRLNIWTGLISPIPLLLLSLMLEDGHLHVFAELHWKAVSGVLYSAYISHILGFTIWYSMIKKYSASLVAPFSLLVPIFGICLASLVLGEKFGLEKVLASSLVILGLALVIFKAHKKEKQV